MSFQIIANDNFIIHEISDKITKLINSIKLISASDFFQYSFCCKENSRTIKFYTGKNIDFCFFIDSDIKTAFTNFIKLLADGNKLNMELSYNILLTAETINFNDEELFELFRIINWQSYKKGKYFFESMKNFSPGLLNMLFNNKISLKDACYFHQTFINQNYDLVLNEIPEKLTFSQTSEIIRNISDYSKKSTKNTDEILKIIKDKEDVLNISFSLKYPHYSKCLEDFNDFLDELNLPKGTEINSDINFEKEEYLMKIKFSDMENLIKKINTIKNNFEKFLNGKKEDKFIQKNLFKNLIKKPDKNEK